MGLDLDDWIRGERHWATFYEMKDRLPSGSAYRAALLEDPELARLMHESLNGQQPPPPPDPSFFGVDISVEKLMDIDDRLAMILAALTKSKVKTMPRPKSAFAKFKKNFVSKQLQNLENLLLPNR